MKIEYNYLPKHKTIIVLYKCKIQLNEAAEYIAIDAPEQAKILLDQFEETVKIIERMPRIGVIYKKGIRKRKLGKFRYNIYYKETKTAVEILGIWHTSKGTKF